MTPEVSSQPAAYESLRTLQQNPDVLIPDRLHELVKNPVEAASFNMYLGRIDDLHEPALSVLFVEKNGLANPGINQEEKDDIWARVINENRLNAISQASITSNDKVLALIIAHDIFRTGVKIESYVQIEELRRKHIGKAFFDNFATILQKQGARYMTGINSTESLAFFLKTGWYPGYQLKTQESMRPPLWLPKTYPRQTSITKFLDRNLETECVQPQYLK